MNSVLQRRKKPREHYHRSFRQDLRLPITQALTAAAQRGAVIPVFVLDDEACGDWAMGGAVLVAKAESTEPRKRTAQSGGELILRRGDTLTALKTFKVSRAPTRSTLTAVPASVSRYEKAINDTFGETASK